MADECRFTLGGRAQIDKRRLTELAERQHGVLSRAQLEATVSGSFISRWLAGGRIHRIHPGVYALGHTALSLQGRLSAALLFAGSGAALSHTTAAWAWQLIDVEPRRIHVAITGRRHSLQGVRVHHTADFQAVELRGLQVTTVSRTLVDVAAMLPTAKVRRVLAEADYRGLLEIGTVRAELQRRRRGSRALRMALANHLPQLAETLSPLEGRFLELCERAGLPLPEVNARVGRMRVDALWRDQNVAVELDGGAAHRGWAAVKRDRQRELALRARGLLVVRYTWEQVTEATAEVVTDLWRLLGDRR